MQLKDDKVFWLSAKASFVHLPKQPFSYVGQLERACFVLPFRETCNLCSLSCPFYFVCLLIEAPKALHSLNASSPQLATRCC